MTDELEKRMAQAARRAVQHRNYRRARDRALARLAHAYPDTYKELLAVERQFDEQQGKKWLDISGNTVLSVGVHTRATGADNLYISQTNSNQDKSNNGGEA
jgi:predicted RNase H-like nuclease (RuvC/YqgF family)